MKYAICVLLLMLTLYSRPCDAGEYNDFNTDLGEGGYSPAVHYGIGGVTAGLVYYYIPDHWELHEFTKSVIAVGASTLVGFVIELADDEIDGRDIFDYAAGGAIVVTVFSIAF